MGGFLGLGGASWKTDRATELSGFGQLKNVFNFALPFAQSTSATGAGNQKTGTDAMSSSLSYFQKILSGNRSAVQQAVAPETNMVRNQADATKRQVAASGTSRGGGSTAVNRQIDTDTMSKIDNAIFGVRPAAATASASIGKDIAGVGLGQTNAALNALNIGENAAADTTSLAAKSRMDSYKINQDMVGKVTNAIDQALVMAFA